jgi:tetratricopeptide (TPR) repeat protein
MRKNVKKIARHEETSADFLVSRADTRSLSEPAAFSANELRPALTESFPDLRWGDGWLEAFGSRTANVPFFAVMVLRPDEPATAGTPEAPQSRNEVWLHAATGLEKACGAEGGFWGILNSGLLCAAFPERGVADVMGLARRLQKKLQARTACTATVGVAGFPTTDFERREVVENAVKALEHAAFFGPNSRVAFDAVSLNISADKLYERGDTQAAIIEFKRALVLDPGSVNVHNSLGVCFGVLGDYEQALNEFSAAVQLVGGDYMAVYNIGLAHWLRGDRQAALDHLLQAYELRAEVFEILFQLGRLYLELGQPATAQQFLEPAARRKTRAGGIYRYLGDCYAALNLTEKAIAAYRKAVRFNPTDPNALSALGCLYDQTGENPEISLVFCRESVKLSPRNAVFRHRLGLLHFRQDRLEEALHELEQARLLGQDTTDDIQKVRERMGEGN